MKPTSDVVACVVDRGFFVHIAQCFGKSFKETFYVNVSNHPLRKLQDDLVGTGMEGVTHASSIWEVKKKCDLFVFTDTGCDWEQKELIEQGYPVWGHHGAGVIEEVKGAFLKSLERAGLNIPPHEVIQGFQNLRDYLWEEKDK